MTNTSVEQRLLEEELIRFNAICSADTVTLSRQMHPDLVYAHTSGNVESRHQFIEALASGKRAYSVFQRLTSNVKVGESLAILHGTAKCMLVSKGVTKDFNIRYLSCLTLTDGEWQLINWQSTAMPSS